MCPNITKVVLLLNRTLCKYILLHVGLKIDIFLTCLWALLCFPLSDLAWQLLMTEEFTELRNTIYTTDEEFKRFRQLVVNSVMATDICDKDLKTLRNARWAKAFSEEKVDEKPRDTVNRKATIVIEHLIQASDM